MEFFGYCTEYNADDEMPDCGCCDNICASMKVCDHCGPEYGWANYKRTEYHNNK